MKRILLSTMIIFLLGCQEETSVDSNELEPTENNATPKAETIGTSYKVNFKDSVGWGYQIFDGTKMVINQEHIPAVQGMKGFDTKEDAIIAAEFILNKIDKGIFPPTISPAELDSLGVYSLE